MRTIEASATVSPEGMLTVSVPVDMEPGEHQVVIVIDEKVTGNGKRPPLDFPVVDLGPWPEGLTVDREAGLA